MTENSTPAAATPSSGEPSAPTAPTSWQVELVKKVPLWLVPLLLAVVLLLALAVVYLVANGKISVNYGGATITGSCGLDTTSVLDQTNHWTGLYSTITPGGSASVDVEDLYVLSQCNDRFQYAESKLQGGKPSWVHLGYKSADIFTLAYRSNDNPTQAGNYLLKQYRPDVYKGIWSGWKNNELIVCPYVLTRSKAADAKRLFLTDVDEPCTKISGAIQLQAFDVDYFYGYYLKKWREARPKEERQCLDARHQPGTSPGSARCQQVYTDYDYKAQNQGVNAKGKLYIRLNAETNEYYDGHFVFRFSKEHQRHVHQVSGKRSGDELHLTFSQPPRQAGSEIRPEETYEVYLKAVRSPAGEPQFEGRLEALDGGTEAIVFAEVKMKPQPLFMNPLR